MDGSEDNDINETPLSISAEDLIEKEPRLVKDEPEADEKETVEMKIHADTDSMEIDGNEEGFAETPISSRFFLISQWICTFK